MWLFLAHHLTCAIAESFDFTIIGEKTGKTVGKTGVRFRSMQRRLGIIIPSPLNDMKATLEAGEPTLIEIQPKALPRIPAAEIEVTEDHPS